MKSFTPLLEVALAASFWQLHHEAPSLFGITWKLERTGVLWLCDFIKFSSTVFAVQKKNRCEPWQNIFYQRFLLESKKELDAILRSLLLHLQLVVRSGRTKSVTTEDFIQKVHKSIMNNRQLKLTNVVNVQRFVIVNESWINHYVLEKKQSKQWTGRKEQTTKKAKSVQFAGKLMVPIFRMLKSSCW